METGAKKYLMSLLDTGHKHESMTGMLACDYCGDRFKKAEKEYKRLQREHPELFEVKKLLMLNLRNGQGISAYNQAFSILKSYNLNLKSPLRGNLHFFAGSREEAKPFLDTGFSFSFTGVITFAKQYEEIIQYLPLARIMSEEKIVPVKSKRKSKNLISRLQNAKAYLHYLNRH